MKSMFEKFDSAGDDLFSMINFTNNYNEKNQRNENCDIKYLHVIHLFNKKIIYFSFRLFYILIYLKIKEFLQQSSYLGKLQNQRTLRNG